MINYLDIWDKNEESSLFYEILKNILLKKINEKKTRKR